MQTVDASDRIDRSKLIARYQRNRRRSGEIFSLVDDAAHYERPIPLRHPFIFYEGHLPAFSFLTLNERALQQDPIDPLLERLFERGIDPSDARDASRHERSDWPSRAAVARFAAECDLRVLDAFAGARLVDDALPRLERGQAAYTILEHEEMHHETLIYIVHRLDARHKGFVYQVQRDSQPPAEEIVPVEAGVATLGADRDALAFGWDNEFETQGVTVPGFGIARYPVTNAQWLEFVKAGGPVPPFWIERDGAWVLRGVFEELPLPLSWPVYATHDQAEAYAAWRSMRLPTEAEYHRAAFGTPGGDEHAFPWGDADPASGPFGNYGFARYDPEPVDAHPAGASAWGVHDLIGNGWEWTATPFGPLPGFEPMASYPQYSTDFFDGKHYVMKGASPVTAAELVRRSFRNWFYADYPYVYAKVRLAA